MQDKHSQKFNELLQANVLDFIIQYTKNEFKKFNNKKASFAWIGTMSKVEASPLQLQKKAIDVWGASSLYVIVSREAA